MTPPVTDEPRLLDGRYELLDRLGSGGMGTVFRAHDRLLDRDVAVKTLRHHVESDEVRRTRLRTEARLAGAVQHPGIVRVLDYGEEPRPDGEATPYVVMQHVEGRPLSALLREQGPLDAASTAHLLASVADALASAHAAGIVHRDLKPSNILLTPAGDPVLVDFGIARSDDEEPLTRTGEILGTADYLSPEQVRGRRATAASDVYALGVVGYQCLTGVSPFHRETHVATALAHLGDELAPLPGTVPGGVRALVRDMLDTDPHRRPTAAEVARRASGGDGEPTTAISVPHVVAARLRRPRPAAVAIAAAVLLVVGVMVAVVTGRDPAASPAAADLAVPSLRGETLARARDELRSAGFRLVVHRVDGPHAAGRVLAQSPDPGPYAGHDRPTVTLRVASGWTTLDSVRLVGRPYAEAEQALSRLGLTAVRTTRASSAAEDTVLAVDAGPRVRVGSQVTLVVATPLPKPVFTPRPGPKVHHGPAHTRAHPPGHAHGDPGPGKAKGHKKKHD